MAKIKAAKRAAGKTHQAEQVPSIAAAISEALQPVALPLRPARTEAERRADDQRRCWDALCVSMHPEYADQAPEAIAKLVAFYGHSFRDRLAKAESELAKMQSRDELYAPLSYCPRDSVVGCSLLIAALKNRAAGLEVGAIVLPISKGFNGGHDFPNVAVDLQRAWFPENEHIGPPYIAGRNNQIGPAEFSANIAKAAALPEQPAPSVAVAPSAIQPADNAVADGWRFEPGLFYFRGRRYELLGYALKLLKIFVESNHASLEPTELYRAWPDDTILDRTNLRPHLSSLRTVLRQVAVDIHANDGIESDPIPSKDGGWQFLLPKQ